MMSSVNGVGGNALWVKVPCMCVAFAYFPCNSRPRVCQQAAAGKVAFEREKFFKWEIGTMDGG